MFDPAVNVWSPGCLGNAENQVFGLKKGWVKHVGTISSALLLCTCSKLSFIWYSYTHILWICIPINIYIYILFLKELWHESPCWHTCSLVRSISCARSRMWHPAPGPRSYFSGSCWASWKLELFMGPWPELWSLVILEYLWNIHGFQWPCNRNQFIGATYHIFSAHVSWPTPLPWIWNTSGHLAWVYIPSIFRR